MARQEEQLAGRLEEQRRQLLDLQDQITEARAALREKRAAHAALAGQQQEELAAAREAADELQRSAKAERQRLVDLRRRLIQRGRRHWQARRKEVEARDADVRRQAEKVAADRAAVVARIEQFNGQVELDKRRLAEAWTFFERERQNWQDRQRAEDAAAAAQVRDLARRAKAVAAAERKLSSDREGVAREIADRRRELEHLETRIGNARLRMLEQHAEALGPANPRIEQPALALPSRPSTSSMPESALIRETQTLARVADDLADQRLHLTEQAVPCCELKNSGTPTGLRRCATWKRSAPGSGPRVGPGSPEPRVANGGGPRCGPNTRWRLNCGCGSWPNRRRAEARVADQRIAMDARWAELDARERTLIAQEDNWRSLLRRWGRRRRQEIQCLRTEQDACRAERGEWVSARAVWLRLAARLRDDRREMAVRALAFEELRAEDCGRARGGETVGAVGAAVGGPMRRRRMRPAPIAGDGKGRGGAGGRSLAAGAAYALAAEIRAASLDDRAAEIEREEQAMAGGAGRGRERDECGPLTPSGCGSGLDEAAY